MWFAAYITRKVVFAFAVKGIIILFELQDYHKIFSDYLLVTPQETYSTFPQFFVKRRFVLRSGDFFP